MAAMRERARVLEAISTGLSESPCEARNEIVHGAPVSGTFFVNVSQVVRGHELL